MYNGVEIHSTVCLTTAGSPQTATQHFIFPFPVPFPLLKSFNSCLRLLYRLPVTACLFTLVFNNMFQGKYYTFYLFSNILFPRNYRHIERTVPLYMSKIMFSKSHLLPVHQGTLYRVIH